MESPEETKELSPSFYIQPAEQSFYRPSPYTSSRRNHNLTSGTKDRPEDGAAENMVGVFEPGNSDPGQPEESKIMPTEQAQATAQTLDQSLSGFMNERKKILARLTPTLGN